MNSVQVPELNGDAKRPPAANEILERRIVANLIYHLNGAGFLVDSVDDGGDEGFERCDGMKSAMEMIFGVCEAWLRVSKDGKKMRTIYLVLGNGVDIISDWNYSEGDADGFNAAMDAFNPEVFA